MAEFLGVVELGTLYKNGSELPLPTRPWNVETTSATQEGGNIPSFCKSDVDIYRYRIGDTSSNSANRLKWVKIADGDKILLICDRVILDNISWYTINEYYKWTIYNNVTIDGVKYKCRLLSGGNVIKNENGVYCRDRTGNYMWTSGEFDRFILNTGNIPGLISDFGYSQTGARNQLWHVWNSKTICTETFDIVTYEDDPDDRKHPFRNVDSRCILRNGDTYSFYQTGVGDASKGIGWRPVLEMLNSPPNISDADKDLGDKNAPFSISYQLTDKDSNSLTVIEKLNGNILRTLNNAPKEQDITINITQEQLYALILNQQNTITIQADDGQGGISYRNYTFKRTNTPPIINNIDKDLGIINSIQEKYKITDMEGNVVSVVEKLDSNILRTFNVDPDKEYVTTVDKDTWIRLKNGQHKYVIEATDFNNAKTIRTFTFTKKETKISFTLAKPFTTDIKATKILITPSWEITGATAKVEACNNAFDVNPTWEDITKQILINRHYNFTNATKIADKWGINIRFTIDKDPTAVNDVCIKGFGGAFE